MTTHLYALCWNEAKKLGFFFRHYDPIVDRYIIYDDGSTDGSIEILEKHPRVELRRWQRANPNSFILSQQKWLNSVWKESRGNADWVLLVDIDEHLVIQRCPIKDYLKSCKDKGVTLLPALGYQMITDKFPEPEELLCQTRTHGAPFYMMSKPSVLDPDAIHESNFSKGRHTAKANGKIIFPDQDELLLLHYRFLGFDHTFKRNTLQGKNLGDFDTLGQLRPLYFFSRQHFQKKWNNIEQNVVDIARPDFNPSRDHSGKVWWRPGLQYFLFQISLRLKWLLIPRVVIRKIKQIMGLKLSPPP